MRKPKLMRLYFVLIISFLTATSIKAQQPVSSQSILSGKAKIIADPDTRISYNGNVVHMESYIAASVTDPDFLFVGGEMIVPGRGLQASEARLYCSYDAGARWTPVLLPKEITGGWDNAVAAGMDGKMYFLTSNLENGLTVYSSSDSGKTWKSVTIKNTQYWDRPYIAVNNTSRSYKGRIYIVAEGEKGISIISSDDGAETFSAPVLACPSDKNLNMATSCSPIISEEGSLFISCAPYPNFPARADWKEAEVGFVVSIDGGQTFSPYKKAFTIHRQLPKDYYVARARGDVLLSGNFMPGPVFSMAPPGSAFAGRFYAVWQDIDSTGRSQLFFSWSSDNGTSWSIPQSIDAAPLNKNIRKGVPMLAVNREGVIGIAWLDGRNAANNKGYDIYFTASIDGGNEFLPSVRLSSATSQPAKNSSNTLPGFLVGRASKKGERTITMTSPFSSRSTGADYSTMTVDAYGRFHPLWMDARDGKAWQLYISTARVISENALQVLAAKQTTDSCVYDNRIQLLFGEPEWAASGKEMRVPVRLLNTSRDTIVKPISVTVSGMALPSARAKTYASAVIVPTFFDVAKKKFVDSTEFVYPISLASPLFPNAVTPEINLQMKITAPEWVDFKLQAVIRNAGCLLVK